MAIEFWPGDGSDMSVLKKIVELKCCYDKPILVFMLSSEHIGQKEIEYLRKYGVTAVRSQELAAKVLGRIAEYSARRKMALNPCFPSLFEPSLSRNEIHTILKSVKLKEQITEFQSKKILNAYNIPCVKKNSIFCRGSNSFC